MLDLQAVINAIDDLPIESVVQIHRRASDRLQNSYFILSDESVAGIQEALRPLHQALRANPIDEADINRLIDEELAEVRRERQAHRGD